MIRVRFLGTAAARPTVGRNVSGIAVQREGESFLWDCGEGTQRQIMRYGSGLSFSHIFITHAHADHFLGIPGLLRTMGLQGREEAMTVYGPAGAGSVLKDAVHMGVERLHFPVQVRSLEDGDRIDFGGWAVHAFAVDHGVAALGYALVEEARLGRFDVEAVRRLGVPEGPLYGRLHRGETIEVDGRVISPGDVVGPPRPGRKVVYSGDTRPNRRTVEMAVGADLLIHEATFGGRRGQAGQGDAPLHRGGSGTGGGARPGPPARPDPHLRALRRRAQGAPASGARRLRGYRSRPRRSRTEDRLP